MKLEESSVSMGYRITKKNKNFRGMRCRGDEIRLGPKTDKVKIGNYNLRKMRRKINLLEDAVLMLIDRVKRMEEERKPRSLGENADQHEGTPVNQRRAK